MSHRDKKKGLVRDGVQALVSDQVGLTQFWSEWQQQQRHFLAMSHSGKLKGGAAKHQADDSDASGDEVDAVEELATLLMESVMGESVASGSPPASEGGHEEASDDGRRETEGVGVSSPRLSEAAREQEPPTTGGQQSSRRRPRTQMSSAPSSEPEAREVLGPLPVNLDQQRDDSEEKMEEREALLQRIAELESRLVDTEVFLSTEPGALIQDLESDLAKTKLRLAHAEAEKDELEVQLMNLRTRTSAKGKENGSPAGWFTAKARS